MLLSISLLILLVTVIEASALFAVIIRVPSLVMPIPLGYPPACNWPTTSIVFKSITEIPPS